MMKSALLTLVVSAFALCFACAGHPDTSGPGWRDLFKPDLSDAEKPDGVWKVEKGVITASADQNLWAAGNYENFTLDLEFMNSPGTNSGVIIYCSDTKNWIPNSVEIQIADDFAEKWAKSPKNWQCGAVFGHLAPTKSVVKKPGEWNRMTIEASGKSIKVWVNGELVSHMDMSLWTSAKKNPDGSDIPSWLNKPFAEMKPIGRIGFQGKHGDSPITFRNIRIKTAG